MGKKTVLAAIILAQCLASKGLYAVSGKYGERFEKMNSLFSVTEQNICNKLDTEREYPYSDKGYLFHSMTGSAVKLSGRIAIVSVFADDATTSWDFSKNEDVDTRDAMLASLDIATDWIEDQAKDYSVDAEFIYSFEEGSDLCYTFSTKHNYRLQDYENYFKSDNVTWEFIEKNIDTSAIMKNHNAQSILFLLFLNTDYNNEAITCTRSYYPGIEYPYEICFIYVKDYELMQTPAIIAHEMLHTFGANDLYVADRYYGITQEYVDYANKMKTNDIMRTCYDIETHKAFYDKITNEITDITAYYIGWINTSATVTKWRLGTERYS